MRLAIAAAFLLFGSMNSAAALDFSKHSNTSGAEYILATGKFELGDEQKLVAMMDEDLTGERVVIFDSPGGVLFEAVSMGQSLRYFGFSTFILPGGECLSACFFAFIGGEKRFVYEGGRLGVHQFYGGPGTDKLQADTQYMTGSLMRFAREMGVSSEAIEIAATTNSDGMHIFSRAELDRLNLSIKHKHVPFAEREAKRLHLSRKEFLSRWRAYVRSSEKADCYSQFTEGVSRSTCLFVARSSFGLRR